MPFLGDDVSFFALLPEGNNGLEETISRLTLDTLRNAMSNTFPVSVDVGIPKFRMEQTLSLRNVGYGHSHFRYHMCLNQFGFTRFWLRWV